jgi:hypothetical protein
MKTPHALLERAVRLRDAVVLMEVLHPGLDEKDLDVSSRGQALKNASRFALITSRCVVRMS